MSSKSNKNIISLAKFLRMCYDLKNDNIGRLTHEDIMIICPDLERVTFDYYHHNICEAAIGKIVLVRDGKGKCIPYRMPVVTYDIGLYDIRRKEEEKVNLDDILESIDISNLSNWELGQLYSELRDKKGSCGLRSEMRLRGMLDKSDSKRKVKMFRQKIMILKALDDYE